MCAGKRRMRERYVMISLFDGKWFVCGSNAIVSASPITWIILLGGRMKLLALILSMALCNAELSLLAGIVLLLLLL